MHRSGCNTSLDWQVNTTYSWCGLTGRKSLFKANLTGVPSLTSPPPSLLFFRAPFYFAPLPTIWTPGTGYAKVGRWRKDVLELEGHASFCLNFCCKKCLHDLFHHRFFYLYLYLKPLETVGCVVKNSQFPFLWTNVTKLSFEEFNFLFFTVEHSVESTKAA